MTRPNLNQPSDLWLVDGSLRDVYVFDTAIADWEKLLAVVQAYPTEYKRDGLAQPMPAVHSVLEDRDHAHLLSVQMGEVKINCHFFVIEEIELDIDPKEITGPKQHNAILQFLEELAHALGKEVVVTAESDPAATLLRYEPAVQCWQVCEPGDHVGS